MICEKVAATGFMAEEDLGRVREKSVSLQVLY